MTAQLRLFVPGDDSRPPIDHADIAAMPHAPRRPLFSAIVEAYMAERGLLAESGSVTPKRWANERRHLVNFKAMFGSCREGDMAPRTFVARWLVANPQWASPDSKRDAVNSLCQCFDWAADPDGANLIGRPIFRRCKITPMLPQVEPREPVYKRQILDVFRVARRTGHRRARNAFRFALHFLFDSGARPCEMRVSCWEHLDWTSGIIELPPELSKTGKKTGKKRPIVLTDRLIRLVRRAWELRGRPESGHIFLNGRGDPIQAEAFCDYFRRKADLAGIPKECTAAGLRHGFAIRHLDDKKSNKRVADLMGHTSTAMIDRVYDRHVRKEQLVTTLRGKSSKR